MSNSPKDSIRVSDLLSHEPMATPEELDQSKTIMSQALEEFGYVDPVGFLILGVFHRIPTTAVDTMAVCLDGSGIPMLMYNPGFVCQLGPTQTPFVLSHEAGHLLYRHLHVDPALRSNANWTMASETVLNHMVQKWTNFNDRMPMITNPKTGKQEETGVNPRKVHDQYRKDLQEQGLTPVDYETFVSTDLTCLSELSRMSKPIRQPKNQSCTHHDDDPGQGMGDSMDQSQVEEIVQGALETAMHDAVVNGAKKTREQLLMLGDKTEGIPEASKVWGNLNLGRLRGEAVQMRKINFWAQWLMGMLATLLVPGSRAKFPRKLVAIADEFDFDLPLYYRGDTTKKTGLVVTDTSGSMRDDVLEFVRKRVGEEDGLEVEYLNFDTCVYPVEADKPFTGGGGTDCQCVLDYVDQMEQAPDFVVMVTDGFMAERIPKDPDKWVWLITPGGAQWPAKHGMATHELPAHEKLDI